MHRISPPSRLGELLLQRRLITEQQLQSAMMQQAREQRPLGEILLRQRAITARQLKRTLKWQQLLSATMLLSSFTLATGPCMASEAQRLTRQLMDNLVPAAISDNQSATAGTPREAGPKEPQWITNLRRGPTAPIVTLLSGQYNGGVSRFTKGLRYRAKWSEEQLTLELRYQF